MGPTRPTPQVARRTEAIEAGFGLFLLVTGAFVLVAVSNPLEIAVYAGGPLIALVALTIGIVAAFKRKLGPVIFGFTGFLLGSLLGVHDFLFPPAIAATVHLGIAIAILGLGIAQLAQKRRFFARWFGNPTQAVR